MSEAARIAQAVEDRPVERLLALYAKGDDGAIAEATKLTLEIITETATWFDGKGDPRAPEAAEKVRQAWLGLVRKGIGEEDAEEFDQRWAIAFEKARAKPEPEAERPEKDVAQAEAEIAEAYAKAAQRIVEENAKADAELAVEVTKPAIIAKPALSPLLPGFEKLPEPPKPPAGATELERLTYPPGLLGHATDHAFRCTDLPDRQLALWGAKAGLGKILDRKLITPKNGSTVAYDLLLAATGAGKEAAIQFALLLLRSAGPGYEKLFRGGMLASVQAIEDLIRLSPNCFIVIDEFGRWFRMIQDQSGNVSELPSTLCKLWGQKPNGRYGVIVRANRHEKEQEIVQIQWPALSIAGASVGQPFWDACGDDDISGGFLNRCLIFDIGVGALDPVEPTRDPDKLEDWFVKALREITRNAAPEQGATPIMSPGPGFEAMGPFRMGWGEAVQEAYLDGVSDVRKLPADSRKRELSIRTPEIALREATKLARWCGARDVWLSHFEWGWAWASHSRDLVLRGANERRKVKRDFEAICDHIKHLLEEGPMMWMDIRIKSRSAAGSFGMGIIDDVIAHMTQSGEIREIEKEEQILRGLRKENQRGAVARWFELGRRR